MLTYKFCRTFHRLPHHETAPEIKMSLCSFLFWNYGQPSMWFYLSDCVVWLCRTGGQPLMLSPDCKIMRINTSNRMQMSQFSDQTFPGGYAFIPHIGFYAKCPCYIKISHVFKTYGGTPPHWLESRSNTVIVHHCKDVISNFVLFHFVVFY